MSSISHILVEYMSWLKTNHVYWVTFFLYVASLVDGNFFVQVRKVNYTLLPQLEYYWSSVLSEPVFCYAGQCHCTEVMPPLEKTSSWWLSGFLRPLLAHCLQVKICSVIQYYRFKRNIIISLAFVWRCMWSACFEFFLKDF